MCTSSLFFCVCGELGTPTPYLTKTKIQNQTIVRFVAEYFCSISVTTNNPFHFSNTHLFGSTKNCSVVDAWMIALQLASLSPQRWAATRRGQCVGVGPMEQQLLR